MVWIRLSGWLFVVLVVVTAAVMGVGSRLPEARKSVVSGVVNASPEEVWALLEEVSREPQWWPGIQAAGMLPDRDGRRCWQVMEGGIGGSIVVPVCEVTSEAPTRWEVRVMDRADGPRLPFGGTWSFGLAPAEGGRTTVTVREERTTPSAMWRFRDRYVAGEDRRAAETLAGLERAVRLAAR